VNRLNISIIEFGVYGLFAYSSMLILVISIIKDTDETKYQALMKSMYMVPGIICAGVLITSGVDITLDTVQTINLTNSTAGATNEQIFYELTDTTDKITLLNPVWGSIHFIIFIVLILYVLKQTLLMLGIGKSTK
jgi:hypothetical protein